MQTVTRYGALAPLFLVLSHSAYGYVLGDGLTLGDVYVSGYSKLAWEAPNNQPQELILDDLSLFASANINQYLNPFIEAEITKAQLWQQGEGSGFHHDKMVLERLYNDFHLTEQLNLRFGKSLAPVGEWNRIHAAPLVWTTNRPVTTRYSFSESVSGLNLQYTQHDNDSYHFYWQPGPEWVEKPLETNRPRHYWNVYGVSFDNYFSLDSKLGMGIQHATVKDTDDRQWVLSLDGQWKSARLDMEFQTTYATIDFHDKPDKRSHEWGGYLQGVWHFNERWHAILRPEYFHNRYEQAQGSMLYGLVYQPQPELSLKMEYVDTQREQPFGLSQGWFGSLAVLF